MRDPRQPSYIDLHGSGELARRAEAALKRLRHCDLCPRACGADRLEGETGYCRTGRRAVVSSYCLHFGEEAPLVGEAGSGTIFFAGCNLRCVFCQNHDLSQPDSMHEAGVPAEPDELAGVMLELQRRGAANINLVSPSHVAAQVLQALPIAADHGLRLPLVWNSGGYDAADTLRLLDGVVDIYMPDTKTWNPATGMNILDAPDYPATARAALAAMHDQTGDLTLNQDGMAFRGVLVRHLVLPGGLAGTREWMCWLAENLSPETYVNLMDQYRPCHRAAEHGGLAAPLSAHEYQNAKNEAEKCGIRRLDNTARQIFRRVFAKH